MSCRAIDVFEDVAPMVGDSGACADTDVGKQQIMDALNLAVEALIKRLDAKGTLWYYEIPLYSGCFPLPEDVLEIRQAWIDGQSVQLRDEWWEGKLTVGLHDPNCCWNRPWVYEYRCGGNNNLIDLGDGFAIPTPWPEHANIKLALVAESESDAGAIVQVIIRDEYGNQQEEFLTLQDNLKPVLSANHVTNIDFLHKPVTQGGVKLYVSYDHDGRRMAHAWYSPKSTTASFRRKKVANIRGNGCGTILIKAKRRFRRLLSETDPMQICDRSALRWGVQAIAAQNRKDPGDYNGMMALAVNELEKELQNATSAGASGSIQFKSPFGGAMRVHAWR